MNPALRHWKQRFDLNATFVFLRPILVGGQQFARGDVMPAAVKQAMGKRLRVWWDARIVAIQEAGADPQQMARLRFRRGTMLNGRQMQAGDSLPEGMSQDLVQRLLQAGAVEYAPPKRRRGRPRKSEQEPAEPQPEDPAGQE